MKNRPGTMKNHENPPTQPGTMKNHDSRPGTMKNQPGTMKTDQEPWKIILEPWETMKTDLEPWKTNLELTGWLQMVVGDSKGGSDHFLWQTKPSYYLMSWLLVTGVIRFNIQYASTFSLQPSLFLETTLWKNLFELLMYTRAMRGSSLVDPLRWRLYVWRRKKDIPHSN